MDTVVSTSTVVAIVKSVTEIWMGRPDGRKLVPDTVRQIVSFGAYAAGASVAGLLAWSQFSLMAWLPVAAALLALASFEAALVGWGTAGNHGHEG